MINMCENTGRYQLRGNRFVSSQGELIVYPCTGAHIFSKIFSSKTTWPIKTIFVEPPWVGGTKVCLRHLGHMTKMAATPIYGKSPQKSSSPEPIDR